MARFVKCCEQGCQDRMVMYLDATRYRNGRGSSRLGGYCNSHGNQNKKEWEAEGYKVKVTSMKGVRADDA